MKSPAQLRGLSRSSEPLYGLGCKGRAKSHPHLQQFRSMLTWILASAVEEGWMDSNPALVTRKFAHTRKRARLTVETYKAIHTKAPGWLQLAMDISLMTLLRRDDVVSLRFTDYRDVCLWVAFQEREMFVTSGRRRCVTLWILRTRPPVGGHAMHLASAYQSLPCLHLFFIAHILPNPMSPATAKGGDRVAIGWR
jgi:hypothetical protein